MTTKNIKPRPPFTLRKRLVLKRGSKKKVVPIGEGSHPRSDDKDEEQAEREREARALIRWQALDKQWAAEDAKRLRRNWQRNQLNPDNVVTKHRIRRSVDPLIR